MRRTVATMLSAAALAIPVADAWAVATASAATKPKKKVVVVSRKFVGPAEQASRWGYVQVTITVRKTTTTIGKKKTVKRRMTAISATSPDHTDRSIQINEQAIPWLKSEALQAQSSNIQMISGATDSSYAFHDSLQAAIVKAKQS